MGFKTKTEDASAYVRFNEENESIHSDSQNACDANVGSSDSKIFDDEEILEYPDDDEFKELSF